MADLPRGDDLMSVVRCPWAEHGELRKYHDVEWGVPEHDDSRLFELLTLEGAQAGLSWLTVLRRREGYRKAFANFDAGRVAHFGSNEVNSLLLDESIIRHRGKIESVVANAAAVVELRASRHTLDSFLWSFVEGKTVQHDWKRQPSLQSSSPESKAMSIELKHRGFRFVGPTTCYSLMQAAGLVNDHLATCFRFRELRSRAEEVS